MADHPKTILVKHLIFLIAPIAMGAHVAEVAAQNGGRQKSPVLSENGQVTEKGSEQVGQSINSLAEFEKNIVGKRQDNIDDGMLSVENSGGGVSPWRAFGSLLIVLSLIIAVTYVFRRFALGGRQGLAPAGVEVLARNSINPKQSLCLVKLGQRVLLLGLSPNQMTALHTIDDPDEVAEVVGLLEKSRPQSITNTFGKLLNREGRLYDEEEIDNTILKTEDGQSQPWYQAKGELSSLLDKVKGLTRMRFRQ